MGELGGFRDLPRAANFCGEHSSATALVILCGSQPDDWHFVDRRQVGWRAWQSRSGRTKPSGSGVEMIPHPVPLPLPAAASARRRGNTCRFTGPAPATSPKPPPAPSSRNPDTGSALGGREPWPRGRARAGGGPPASAARHGGRRHNRPWPGRPALYAVHGLRGSGVDPNQRTRQRRETMFAGVGSAIRCDGSPLQSGRLRCSKPWRSSLAYWQPCQLVRHTLAPDTDTVHLPTPGLFTTDPGITRRTPVNMARCSIEACFGFDGPADKASPPTGRLRTNNPKLPGPAPPPPGQSPNTVTVQW